jgi:hypothetical protein
VLPEVEPSNSCGGCDCKQDHQKSQHFHSSPTGREGATSKSALDTGSTIFLQRPLAISTGRYAEQPREFLIQRIEVRQKVPAPGTAALGTIQTGWVSGEFSNPFLAFRLL